MYFQMMIEPISSKVIKLSNERENNQIGYLYIYIYIIFI